MPVKIITKKDTLEVSSVGRTLTESVEASEDVLAVALELHEMALQIDDQSQQAIFEQWADRLAKAVIVASTSASSTATDIQALYPDTDDKPKNR